MRCNGASRNIPLTRMASPVTLKPTHKAVRAYYLALAQLANVGASHETAVRDAFHQLVETCLSIFPEVLDVIAAQIRQAKGL